MQAKDLHCSQLSGPYCLVEKHLQESWELVSHHRLECRQILIFWFSRQILAAGNFTPLAMSTFS